MATANDLSALPPGRAVIGAMYVALYEGRELDADSLLEEVAATVPPSVSRREDVEHARGRFVPVR